MELDRKNGRARKLGEDSRAGGDHRNRPVTFCCFQDPLNLRQPSKAREYCSRCQRWGHLLNTHPRLPPPSPDQAGLFTRSPPTSHSACILLLRCPPFSPAPPLCVQRNTHPFWEALVPSQNCAGFSTCLCEECVCVFVCAICESENYVCKKGCGRVGEIHLPLAILI